MRSPQAGPRRKSAGQHPAQRQRHICICSLPLRFWRSLWSTPSLMTLRMGFYQSYVYLTDTGTGFGLNSFRYVLQDPAFGLAVRNTMYLLFLVGVPITIVLSLRAALLINPLLRTKGLFQTLYFLPYVTSTLAIGLVFR